MKNSTIDAWTTIPLSELVSERGISYGIVQPGEETADGVPVIRVNNMAGNRLNAADVKRVSAAVEAKYSRTRLQGGEVLLSLVGTLGLAAIAPAEVKGWNVARAVGVLPFDSPELAYWVVLNLRSVPIQQFIRTRATTTVQATFNLGDVAEIPIPMPPEDVRRRISEIAGAFDEKIELNRRMNETLEAMARAIFKSWFVDFDPVRAKSEGRQPQGIPAHIADLFPSTFQDSPLGPIPKGWQVRPFDQSVEIIGGGTPKTTVAEYWDGETPWFSVVDAPRHEDVWVIATEKHITERGLEESSTRLLEPGTTIISARGTVGRVALCAVQMAMNQSCYGLKGTNGIGSFATYFGTRALVDELLQRAHGSVFDTITRSTFAGVQHVVTSPAVAASFEEHVRPQLELVRSNLLESRVLAQTRDTLLPRLLSGQVHLP